MIRLEENPTVTLAELLTVHGAASLDKQESMAALVQNSPGWDLDLTHGKVTFGGEYSFPLQLLGQESDLTQTWLWEWANEEGEASPAILYSANYMRAYGEENGIAQLTEPSLDLTRIKGRHLSIIASGICGADAYFRAPFLGGAAFVLLTAPEARHFTDDSVERVKRIYETFISQYRCNQKEALFAYADYKGYHCQGDRDQIECVSPRGERIIASFNSAGRLSNLITDLTANPEYVHANPDNKPRRLWWQIGN